MRLCQVALVLVLGVISECLGGNSGGRAYEIRTDLGKLSIFNNVLFKVFGIYVKGHLRLDLSARSIPLNYVVRGDLLLDVSSEGRGLRTLLVF